MASDPRIRASDADRDRTAALLREHLAAGRLSSEEFNERLDQAYAAKTLGELDQLLADLPGIDLYHLPDHSVERRRGGSSFGLPWLLAPRGGTGISPAWRAAWGSWAIVSRRRVDSAAAREFLLPGFGRRRGGSAGAGHPFPVTFSACARLRASLTPIRTTAARHEQEHAVSDRPAGREPAA